MDNELAPAAINTQRGRDLITSNLTPRATHPPTSQLRQAWEGGEREGGIHTFSSDKQNNNNNK